MNTSHKDTYVIVKDENGYNYICPLEAAQTKSAEFRNASEECVEKDVFERYSANINIQTA